MEEFDIEISLRQRLAATIESRIAWAVLLRDSLSNSTFGIFILLHIVPSLINPPVSSDGASFNFQEAAMEALQAIEAPCDIIFGKPSDALPFPTAETRLDLHPPTSRPLQIPTQPRARSYRNRDCASSRPIRPASKLLFIRDNSTFPPIIAKMQCPDCSRGDFTNLQGLLNHCRLRHSKDYGSHDECMQQCAVIGPEEDRDWVVGNGTELSGVSLPSLRRLFEIAVGNDAADTTEPGEQNQITEAFFSAKEEAPQVNYLTRTLGHHKDTPALAPFLGRAPKRRCINDFHDDEPVDIESHSEVGALKQPWRMPYAHRSVANSGLDTIVEPERPGLPSVIRSAHQQLTDAANTSGTRFHMVVRVVISDRSLWLPPSKCL